MITVRYIPGPDGASRLSSQVNWIGLGIFALSIAALAFFGYRLWREAAEATRDRPSGRRARP
jgi:hypothetical protein